MNDGANSIYKITVNIEAASGFSIDTTTISCPSGWAKDPSSSTSKTVCITDGDPGNPDLLTAGNSKTITFSATSPSTNQQYTWTVDTKDNNWGSSSNTDAKTTVDSTPPTITSITTKDTDGDGAVEQQQ